MGARRKEDVIQLQYDILEDMSLLSWKVHDLPTNRQRKNKTKQHMDKKKDPKKKDRKLQNAKIIQGLISEKLR